MVEFIEELAVLMQISGKSTTLLEKVVGGG